MCKVQIPNKEINSIYQKEILDKLTYIIPKPSSNAIIEAIHFGEPEKLKKHLQKLFRQTVSSFMIPQAKTSITD